MHSRSMRSMGFPDPSAQRGTPLPNTARGKKEGITSLSRSSTSNVLLPAPVSRTEILGLR